MNKTHHCCLHGAFPFQQSRLRLRQWRKKRKLKYIELRNWWRAVNLLCLCFVKQIFYYKAYVKRFIFGDYKTALKAFTLFFIVYIFFVCFIHELFMSLMKCVLFFLSSKRQRTTSTYLCFTHRGVIRFLPIVDDQIYYFGYGFFLSLSWKKKLGKQFAPNQIQTPKNTFQCHVHNIRVFLLGWLTYFWFWFPLR